MTAWVEIVGWAVTVIAVAGVVFNNHRRRECFWLWLVSNGLSAAIHLSAGMIALTVRDCVFIVLAVDGLRRWRKLCPPSE